jgi:acyl carrier protein
LKDLVIIGGRNLFPQDIEETITQSLLGSLVKCAAFSVDAGRGEALAIVAELPRQSQEATYPDLVRAIRRVVIEVHEVDPRHVLLVRQASIPLTSSGKVQRSRCRQLFDSDDFKCRHRYDRSSASQQTPIPIPVLPDNPQAADRPVTQAAIESWMVEWLIARGGVAPHEIDVKRPFAEYGLDSMTAVEMSGEIEDWSGVELTPVVAWKHPTVSSLTGYITDQLFAEHSEASHATGGAAMGSLLGNQD